MNENVGSDEQLKWLVLIPTAFEATKIQDQFLLPSVQVEVCGFGPIVSAAQSAYLVNTLRPINVMLAGIAGCYDSSLKVGSAYRFSSVASDGIGAGEGQSFQSAKEMGWSQGIDAKGKPISDSIPLNHRDSEEPRQLLTVCAAADGATMTESRRQRFPNALAEDMEGFAVAAACQICDVELTIVRGISNRAGDREKSNWKIDEALTAAAKLALDIIGSNH